MKRDITIEYNGSNDNITFRDPKKFKECKLCDLKPFIHETFAIPINEIKFKINEVLIKEDKILLSKCGFKKGFLKINIEKDPEQTFKKDPEQTFKKDPEQTFKKDPEQTFKKYPKQTLKKDPEQTFKKDPEQTFKKDCKQDFKQEYKKEFKQDYYSKNISQSRNDKSISKTDNIQNNVCNKKYQSNLSKNGNIKKRFVDKNQQDSSKIERNSNDNYKEINLKSNTFNQNFNNKITNSQSNKNPPLTFNKSVKSMKKMSKAQLYNMVKENPENFLGLCFTEVIEDLVPLYIEYMEKVKNYSEGEEITNDFDISYRKASEFLMNKLILVDKVESKDKKIREKRKFNVKLIQKIISMVEKRKKELLEKSSL